MMKRLTQTLIAAVALLTALPSVADHRRNDRVHRDRGMQYSDIGRIGGKHKAERRFGRHLDKRQTRQWRRIEQGIDSGELTHREARRLKRQQRKIARLEERFASDHRYSADERYILVEKRDRASEAIYRKKHNRQVVNRGHGRKDHRYSMHQTDWELDQSPRLGDLSDGGFLYWWFD